MSRKRIDRKTHDLAARIAMRLFTNGCSSTAQRLVLTIDTPVKRDLGGWSLAGAVCEIEKELAGHPESEQ